MAAGANANLGNNIPIPAPPAAGGGTETPLPAQFAGNAQGVAGLTNVGINPGTLGDPIVNPVLTPIQQSAYTQNYDTAMNQQQGALTPFMQAIAGQLGGSANLGAYGGLTMQEIAEQYFPQFNQNAMGLANSQQGFSNSLDASALGSAINRLLTANQYTSGGGGGNGAATGTGNGLNGSGFNNGQVTGLGSVPGGAPAGGPTPDQQTAANAYNAANPLPAVTGPAATAPGTGTINYDPITGYPTSQYIDPTTGQPTIDPSTGQPYVDPSTGLPYVTDQGTPNQGGGVQYTTPPVPSDSGGLGGTQPNNQPYQMPPNSNLGTPDSTNIGGGFNGSDAGGAAGGLPGASQQDYGQGCGADYGCGGY